MKIKSELNKIISNALEQLNIDSTNVSVTEATKSEFGDFQYNGVMALAKAQKKNPRELAAKIVSIIEKSHIFSKVEVAGPGFINLTISFEFLEKMLVEILDVKKSVSKRKNPIKVVVDYPSQNMAKEMHAGHLRPIIIGDALANLFEFLGDNVIRQNHIGDWGTQFGMLVAHFEEVEGKQDMELSDLEKFYKAAKKRFDNSPEFAKKSRQNVVKLQGGDEYTLKLWENFIEVSLLHCQEIFDSMNVSLNSSHVKGESSYNSELANIINDLEQKGIAKESQGAKCVFNENNENPFIVQKADGGYLYATTDIAAVKFRVEVLKAQRIAYVVDARQSEHFKQVFKTAIDAKYTRKDTSLEHIAFGMMLDQSGSPFKTRDGGVVKLKDLIEESINRAKLVINRENKYTENEVEYIAKIVGIGALKYADLSINRQSNYIFDWDKMLSLDGNTALYAQYAYARINSILTKAKNYQVSQNPKFSDNLEKKLALKIILLDDVLSRAYKEATPHTITTYIYELTSLFMRFYEYNPILRSDVSKEQRETRLLLAQCSANTIKISLNILGIEVLERV